IYLNHTTTLDMEMEAETNTKTPMKTHLALLFNSLILTIGQVGGPMLLRIYFTHGGQKRWLAAWTNTAGFPILLIPIALAHRRRQLGLPRRLFISCVLLGFLVGFVCYLYAYGAAYLPVSVHSLISSSQLVFTAVSAYLVVRQKFTPYSVNAVVLMTLGSAALGLHMEKDVPEGETLRKYVLGFCMTVGAACFHGLFLTLVEYAQAKAKAGGVAVDFDVAMQVQFVILVAATFFCTVPMIVNRDFQTMSKEAAEFGLGKTNYYLIVFLAVVALQLNIIGVLGVVMTSSSLFAGILSSLLVPVQQVFAVIFLREGFSAEKGMALALCLWGFASHLYGGYKATLARKQQQEDPEEATRGRDLA
ncbi:unnamed protein product, partial [Linum tenue]